MNSWKTVTVAIATALAIHACNSEETVYFPEFNVGDSFVACIESPRHLETGFEPNSPIEIRTVTYVGNEFISEVEDAISVLRRGESKVEGQFEYNVTESYGIGYDILFVPDESLVDDLYTINIRPGQHLVPAARGGMVSPDDSQELEMVFTIGNVAPIVTSIEISCNEDTTLKTARIEFSEMVRIESDDAIQVTNGEINLIPDDFQGTFDHDPLERESVYVVFNDGITKSDLVNLVFDREKITSVQGGLNIDSMPSANGDDVIISIVPEQEFQCSNYTWCWMPLGFWKE